ncbi:uncharacterized protein METZ01_LOCUS32260, partial [marine metagenome]
VPAITDLNESHIGFLRKSRVALDCRTKTFDGGTVDVIDRQHRVWIADGCDVDPDLFFAYVKHIILFTGRRIKGHRGRLKQRRSHVDRYLPAVLENQFKLCARRLNNKVTFVCPTVFYQITGETACPITALAHFCAICIENTHNKISRIVAG